MRRHRIDFTLPRAFALTVALCLSAFLQAFPSNSEAGQVEEGTFRNGVFVGAQGEFEGKIVFLKTGVLKAHSPFGTFSGTWRVFEGQLCVWFDFGPKQGLTCQAVREVGPGQYVTADGLELTRIASAYPLERAAP